MNPATDTVHVTGHALARYRERFAPTATAERVAELVRQSEPAPAWVRKTLARHDAAAGSDVFLVSGEAVFAVVGGGPGAIRVVTVLPLHWARVVHEKVGTKNAKRYGHKAARWKRS